MPQGFLSVAFGAQPFWTKQNTEISTRLLVVLFFLGPILFVTIETSPTAWAVLTALSAAVSITNAIKFQKSLYSPAIVLALILALVAASLFWTIDKTKTAFAVRDFLGFGLAALTLLNCLLSISENDCSRVRKAFTCGSMIAILALFAIEVYIAARHGQSPPVADVITLHKITFYGALFAAWHLAENSRTSTFIALLYAISTIALGHSAGIGAAIIVVAVLYALPDRGRRPAVAVIISAYVIGAFAAPAVIPRAFSYLDASGALSYKPNTFAGRLELWDLVLKQIWNAPILGHGANTIRNAMWLITNPRYYGLSDLPSAHNIVIDIWFELGVTGIAFMSVSIIALSTMIYKLPERLFFLCSSLLLTIVIELTVDHRVWLSWVLGTLILAIAISIIYSRDRLATVKLRTPEDE